MMLSRVQINRFGPASTTGPGMGTHFQDPRVNETCMVSPWVMGAGLAPPVPDPLTGLVHFH